MKSDKRIFIAFILNFMFSIFEFFGGIITGSVAILSDAIHDIGDAVSIGFSAFLERKSNKEPDKKYTYGYARFSVLGSLITTLILITGSVIVTINAIRRILSPAEINYEGMIAFALIGAAVNFFAAFFTHGGSSLNQRAVNLHMLEDVLGWIVVLVGAIVMKLTDFPLIDPVMSIGVAVFILVNAMKNLKEIATLFLIKVPDQINVDEIKEHILEIKGVADVHHLHIWSTDSESIYATMHIVTNENPRDIKERVKEELREYGISHTTLELEKEDEVCNDKHCHIRKGDGHCHHHHH